ncbi:MAG: tRNA uridine(34) 5-carboxymethylaminomethyl modification radical SAM/GNAT enzyme Elp3 [bacterium]
MINFLLQLNPRTQNGLSQAKREIASKFRRSIPLNSELIEAYHKYLAKTNSAADTALLAILKRRRVRTGSGVAPVAILTKPYPCPGKCFYCPNEKGMPKSYLSNEPAVMRAIISKFDPVKQIKTRIKALEANGHPTDKIEIIIMGGTWSYLPKSYQLNYIIKCFETCNEIGNPASVETHRNASLQKLQKQNEKSDHRIVGLTLETRPDYITEKEIQTMREFGCTRVELGVQAVDDKILSVNRRGQGVKEIIDATRMLREAGFKICYHMMVNLPGSDPEKDFQMFKELFKNPAFQPDQIKIYPCVITKNAPLYRWYKSGKYKPYTDKELLKLLIKIKENIPPYVRVIRVIRDIPSTSIVAGNKISNLREMIQKKMNSNKKSCQCIRCREIGNRKIAGCKMIIREYYAGGGKEYFLSYEDVKQDKLIAFLRLRISSGSQRLPFSQAGTGERFSIIREVHTYGPAIEISKRASGAAQHIGLGKKLIKKAELIARKNKCKKIAVISGVGVRSYYRRLGYGLQNTYMVKKIL